VARKTTVKSSSMSLTPIAAALAALPFVYSPAQGQETTLPEVTVTNAGISQQTHPGGQLARGGSLGILGTEDAMDVPFSTTNFTSQLLEDQQIRTLADVVVNDASVRMGTSTTGFGEDFVIRGFAVPSGDVGLNGLYGLVSASRLSVNAIERVELLKGPGALMNGIPPNGSIGGGINNITKRAADKPLTRLTATYAGESQLGLHLDVGRRYGPDNAWGVRVNGVIRQGETSIDNGNQDLAVGSLNVDYRGQRLRWSLDIIRQDESISELRPQIGLRAGSTALPAPSPSRTNFYPNNPLTLRDYTIATGVEYDFSEHLTGYARFGIRDGEADQVFPQTSPVAGVTSAGDFVVRRSYYDSYSTTMVQDAGLRARFQTGSVHHTVALGVSRLAQEAGNAFVAGTTSVPSNIYNPSPLPPTGLPRGEPSKASNTVLSSVALSDTMSFLDDRLLLTLGARDQTVVLDSFNLATGARTNHYEAGSISPLVGIVYKPVHNVSVYGNTTRGLTRGQIVAAPAANAGTVLPPYKSEQREVGVKADFGKFTTGAALFQITRPNSLTDPVTTIVSYDGETRSRGLELSAFGEPVRGLRGMVSTVFYDAKVTRTAGGLNQGKDAVGVADRTLSAGLEWDTPWLAGLSLNGRAIYTGSMPFNAANTIYLPAWTRYDIGARYRTVISGKSVVFRANIENLQDKNVWLMSGGSLTVSSGRTALLSASVDF